MIKIIVYVFLLHLNSAQLNAFNFFPEKKPASIESTIELLAKKVKDYPSDPSHLYNLGVAHYKANKFDLAAENFDKSLSSMQDMTDLKMRNLYNSGISHLQHTHSILPEDWKNDNIKIEGQVLDQAIKSASRSVENLEQCVQNNSSDAKSKKALETAQDILEKLQKRKQQQEQEKKDQEKKNDKENKDQQNSPSQNDKDKQQKNDKPQDSSDQNKQEQNKNNPEEKKEASQNQKGSDNKQDVDDKENKSDQRQDQSDREDGANEPHNSPTDRDEQQSEDKNAKDEKQSDVNSEQAHDHQPSQQESMETKNENQESGGLDYNGQKSIEEESTEMKRIRAVLENLQADESKAQKRVLIHQAKQGSTKPQHGQKPW